MEKRENQLMVVQEEEKSSKSAIPFSFSDDDEEGNEDLSSKIVEKALLRACNATPNYNTASFNGDVVSVVDLNLSSSLGAGASISIKGDTNNKKKIKKEKKQKDKKIVRADLPAYVVNEEENTEKIQAMEIFEALEPNTVEKPDNIVLRKLLRGPRYFDPQDSSLGACFNCGEEGHSAANCTGPKRIKPCFVCGSLDHISKKCIKGKDCYICKKGGHRAKDCPEKYGAVSLNSKMCLICGHSGHDMFSCRNDYSLEDLKGIQCYVCNNFGHLCCTNSISAGPRKVSCYKCGQPGHTGLACSKSHGENTEPGTPSSCFRCGEGGHFAVECTNSAKTSSRSNVNSTELGTPRSCYKCGEVGHFARECVNSSKASFRSHVDSTQLGTPSSCFKCGEEGHFARECVNSTKVGKRSHEYSTSNQTIKGNKAYMGFKYEAHDIGKPYKRKKNHYEEIGMSTPTPRSSSKQRGGWITEDLSGGDQNSYSRSYKKGWMNYSEDSTAQWSGKSYKYGVSASRFGNGSSNGKNRNYDWW